MIFLYLVDDTRLNKGFFTMPGRLARVLKGNGVVQKQAQHMNWNT